MSSAPRIATTQVRGLGPLPALVEAQASRRALAALFGRQELPLALVDHPETRLPLIDVVELFDGAARVTGDAGFGLKVGSQMRAEDFGPWVSDALTAPSLGSALLRLVRNVWRYQPNTLQLEVEGDRATLRYRPQVRLPSSARHHADHVLAPMVDFVRRYLGAGWLPQALLLPYADRPAVKRAEDHFASPAGRAADGVGIVVPRELLGPMSPDRWAGQPSIARAVDCDSTLTGVTTELVATRLLGGRVDLEGVARLLRMHPRVVQRGLAAEGTSYREIVDRVRLLRAQYLLARTGDEIADVALRLGYEEPAHFSRAFRRWTGVPPSAWRRGASRAAPDLVAAE